MLKVDDIQAITDYCRVAGNSIRKAAKVFQRSRNTVARVLETGMERLQAGYVRRRQPQVLMDEHREFIDAVLLGREGGVVCGKQKHNGISITNLLRTRYDYQGSVSQVRRYIKRRRGELGILRGDVTMDRVKEANGLCEADWPCVNVPYVRDHRIHIAPFFCRKKGSVVHGRGFYQLVSLLDVATV